MMSNIPKTAADPVTAPFRAPYLIYFGDVQLYGYAKTGMGLVEWRRELCAGQLRQPGARVDAEIPDLTVEEAVKRGVGSLVIGVAPSGGGIPQNWLQDLVSAARAGLDIVSGMHARLDQFPELVEAARMGGGRLVDLRVPPPALPIGTGEPRSGKRLLTVGTDCAVGKKYTALALERALRTRGVAADFRATGQTGIMIAGAGVPIDAVVADFISGAAETLSPPAADDHWDIIEGQGAITNPSYAGVSLGLLHGSQPDALVMCHDPAREHHLGSAQSYPLVPIAEVMELTLMLARRVNPAARFVGISINSSGVTASERERLFAELNAETRLPVIDPIVTGADAIADHLLSGDAA